MREKPIITSIDEAVCKNCIFSYQQPISFRDETEAMVTVCAHSKHQGNDHDFCEDGAFLTKGMRELPHVVFYDSIYEVLNEDYGKARYAGAGGSYGVNK